VDLGVKTKTQLVAERQVLVALIAAVIGAGADEQLGEVAGPFARGICRHFAMLFAAGAQVNRGPPPPPGRGARPAAYAATGSRAAPSFLLPPPRPLTDRPRPRTAPPNRPPQPAPPAPNLRAGAAAGAHDEPPQRRGGRGAAGHAAGPT
jgi:hypothetical protein